MSKILSQFTKKLKEESADIHNAYADALGSIVHHVVGNLEECEDIDNVMDTIFTMIFTNLNQPSGMI